MLSNPGYDSDQVGWTVVDRIGTLLWASHWKQLKGIVEPTKQTKNDGESTEDTFQVMVPDHKGVLAAVHNPWRIQIIEYASLMEERPPLRT